MPLDIVALSAVAGSLNTSGFVDTNVAAQPLASLAPSKYEPAPMFANTFDDCGVPLLLTNAYGLTPPLAKIVMLVVL